MGQQIDGIPHECGTSKGLKVFLQDDGSIDGYCYRCKTRVDHPYGENTKPEDVPKRNKKSKEQIEKELVEIASYPTVSVEARKLAKQALDEFEVKVSLSEKDGKTPTALYFPVYKGPELVGYHVKLIDPPKDYTKAFVIGDVKDCDLLNWHNAKTSGAYELIITEGPEDMVSAWRIHDLYTKPEAKSQYGLPAVVSLPFGAASAKKYVSKHAEEIKKRFKKVILSFDDDEAGHDAVKDVKMSLPDALIVTLPYKDANECLMKGVAQEAFKQYRFNPTTPKNSRIVRAADVYESARTPAKWGELTWPWNDLNKAMRGLRLGETTYIGGAPKIGKTVVKNSLGAHFIKNGSKVFMACPEEPNEMSYKLIANQLTGKIFHDPEVAFDNLAFDKARDIIADKLYMLSLYQFLGWDTLKGDIIAAVEDGCEVVMIDPITSLTNGISAGETNTLLSGFAQELAGMAKDMNFHAIMFCHLKESDGQLSEEKRQAYYKKGQYTDLGPVSHGWGGSIYSSQFTGSRAMARSCHLMMGIMGNKDPDLEEGVRNTRELIILEDRNWGNSAKFPLFYNKKTGQLLEQH